MNNEQDEHLINHFSDLIDQYTYKLNLIINPLQKFKDKLQNVKNIEQINTILLITEFNWL